MEEKKKKTQTKNKKTTKKVQPQKNNTQKKQTQKKKTTTATKKSEPKKTVKNSKEATKELTPIVKKIKETDTKEKETINFSVGQSTDFPKFIKIVLIIIGIMLVFYAITMIATKKADEKTTEAKQTEAKEKTEIQYDDIMIGTMLNKDGDYYVLIKDSEDNRVTEYESLISTISSSEDAPKIYKANLTDSFNKNYLGKEENYYTEDIKDFKVKGTTLLKIEDKKVVSALDNYDAIKNKLNELQ